MILTGTLVDYTGQPYINKTVTLIGPTTIVFTTNGTGFYNRTVAQGTYDVLVTGVGSIGKIAVDATANTIDINTLIIYTSCKPLKDVAETVQVAFQYPTANTGGQIPRNVPDKLSDFPTVKDYGAKGDGVTDDTAAITAFITAFGYVSFPRGTFKIAANYTIAVPQYYDVGAAIFNDVGVTVTITNRIIAPNQWIFKGTGPLIINIVSTMGEDAKRLRAGWFGVFPTNALVDDITVRMQRALNSMNAQTREGILQLECGSYHLSGTIYVPRGVEIAGRGTRRTIFDITGLNFTVFETAGNACKFSDFQFEYPLGQDGVRTQPYIHVKHNTCDIINLHLFPSTVGILIDEVTCYIENLRVTYGLDPKPVGADTSLIWCRASSFRINGVSVLNTTYYPHHIIRVGTTSTISAGMIESVHTSSSANSVFLDGRSGSITRMSLSNLMSSPSAGEQFSGVVKAVADSTSIISYINMVGLTGTSYADSLVHLEANGASSVQNICIGNSSIQNSAGAGLRFLNNGSGSMRNIYVGKDVDVSGRTTRLDVVGTVSYDVPAYMKGSQFGEAVIQNFSLADDTAFVIQDNRTAIFAGVLIVSSSSATVNGMFSVRAASSANHVTQMVGTAAMATTTTNLTGTTGVDGKFTIGINASGKLVVENRTGSGLTMNINLLAGP